MTQNTETTISKQQKIRSKSSKNWNLKQIFQQIEIIKRQTKQEPLTSLEKTCLTGLFCGFSPEKISEQLPDELDYYTVQITFWTLYRYLKLLTNADKKAIANYQDVINSLEIFGYKAENILLDDNGRQNSASALVKAQVKPIDQDSSASESQVNTLTHQLKQNSLTQVDENDFMPAVSLWTKLGGLFLVGSVGIAIALSAFTPYKVTVQAQAKVRPAGELKIVEAKTEGTVVEIKVRENQPIKQGEVIAIIDSSRLETQKSQRQSQVQQSKLQLTQINAQIRSLERQIQAEKERIQRAVQVATVELSRSRREYLDRQITTQAEVAEAEANVRLAEEEWQQAQAQFNSAQANLKSNQAALASATSKRNRYKTIAATGALSQNQLEEAQLEVEQLQQQVAAQQATVEEQKRGIARQQQAIEAAEARLNNVRAALNPSDGEVAIATQRIAQESSSGKATIAALNREKEAVIQQQIELEQQLARDYRELNQINRDLKQNVITAPANGTLFQLSLRNPSQTVQAGSEIARIAPSETSLAIEALVSSSDIAKVQINQKAQVKISACPYPDYGTLKGVVTRISPDAIPYDGNSNLSKSQNRSQTNGAFIYKVLLKPDHLTLSQGKNQCPLQLGMEGKADVITKEEKVLQFLLRKARLNTDI